VGAAGVVAARPLPTGQMVPLEVMSAAEAEVPGVTVSPARISRTTLPTVTATMLLAATAGGEGVGTVVLVGQIAMTWRCPPPLCLPGHGDTNELARAAAR